MQFPVKTGAPATLKTACAIVPIFESAPLSGVVKTIDKAAGGVIQRLVRSRDASAKLGRTLVVRDTRGPASTLLLVGCGPRAMFGQKQLGVALAAVVQALADTSTKEALSYLGYDAAALDAYTLARTTVQIGRGGTYRFTELKSKHDDPPVLRRLGLPLAERSAVPDARRGIAHGQAIANGMDLARDLGNRPANVCTPSHIAAAASELSRQHTSIQVKVIDESEMRRLGMGSFLSVTQGAAEPAKMIVIEYRGAAKRSAPPIALCGKGVTFDTGGISLKPPAKMDEMKFDMCGAASVLATMASIAELEVDCNVVAVIPACENMPGDRATRPGDIVTSLSGQTIEILNTDAEGRLILCDALTYAQQKYKPRKIVDVATLTGACVIALGPLYSGLFSNDESLAIELLEAGKRTLDYAWRLPVDEEYGESLRSNFADFANAGSRDGGASVAAQFLSRFVEDTPWAHLDIAGVAWRGNSEKGATGRPVPLLVDFILNDAERS
jgi:leucyl aminopeptidase